MHIRTLMAEGRRGIKKIGEERDRDRWKEGCVCLWWCKDVLAQALVVRLQ